MAARKVTAVCRDCGEVMHVDLAAMKPGTPVACPGCGLLATNLPSSPRSAVLPARRQPAEVRR